MENVDIIVLISFHFKMKSSGICPSLKTLSTL